ncbi:hypothetical protein D1AOALGA4SA_573 [Olavius algarvensis Delta 1 endosymbiont]|nr:hypothetical protein D1AOALGA4SA_573 [Olavius algarvensis Delta 1 endosymbiont]
MNVTFLEGLRNLFWWAQPTLRFGKTKGSIGCIATGGSTRRVRQKANECISWQLNLSKRKITIEWTHKRKNSHYISMIR